MSKALLAAAILAFGPQLSLAAAPAERPMEGGLRTDREMAPILVALDDTDTSTDTDTSRRTGTGGGGVRG